MGRNEVAIWERTPGESWTLRRTGHQAQLHEAPPKRPQVPDDGRVPPKGDEPSAYARSSRKKQLL